jgi:glycosyltransferase involved in cell wall biosynthesis
VDAVRGIDLRVLEKDGGGRMKLLLVTQYFWPENFRINDLAGEFHKRGHEVTVLTGLPNYPTGQFFPGYGVRGPYREQHDGVDIIRCFLLPRGGGGGVRLSMNYLSFALSATIRGLLACRKAYDVIFVHEPSPLTVALPAIALRKLTGAPLLLWVLDLWPESVSATQAVTSPVLLRLIERMVHFIYRRCDRILVQSKAFVSHVERQGAAPRKIAYFPSWAEALYVPTAGQPSLPDGVSLPDGFRIMFAGNIGEAQDFGTILGAAERLRSRPDIHWIILGDGRMFGWVQDEVRRRQLTRTVHLLGRYPLEGMPAFFAQADAMLVTLRREPIFALTIPGKVQSYLASGRPIIAALDGEGARIVQEAGAGVVCPAEQPEALADAAEKMADLPGEDRASMGRRGAEYYAAHFDRTVLFDQLEGWIREFAVEQGGTRPSPASQASLSKERGKLS